MMTRWNRGPVRTGSALALACVLATGCDELLKVEDPDTLVPGSLDDPAVLDVVINGAIGDFVGALNGGDAYLAVSGVMTDELFSSGTFPTRTATDRRDQFPTAQGNTSDGAYVSFQEARRALKDAAVKVAEFRGTEDPAYSELKSLEAFTHVFLSEGFCGAVPFSSMNDAGEFEYGQPQSTDQLFTGAVSLFDEALAAGGGHLAAVGKARALLNLGQFAQAAAAVTGVPTNFVHYMHHSVSGTDNGIYGLQGNGRYSVSEQEGINGLPFRSAMDPRVPWFRDPEQPDGFDAAYPLYKSLKYVDFDIPVVLASGVEARLIEAEAALNADDATTWLTRLNELRAAVATLMPILVPRYSVSDPMLAALTDPGDPAARRNLMFSERAFWLYLTGHRLGDLRRLVSRYSVPENQAFPTGAYHKGGTFGADVTFPIDFDEGNNENYNIGLCNVLSAN